MDSRQLAYFCAVVRLDSFTKAAESSNISQSAISQQIRALEADIGCELLERRGRHFSVTPAGALLARKGEKLLRELSELEAEVYDISSDKPRTLSVGYLNRYDGWEVARAVASFVQRHPGCEVQTMAGTHEQLYLDALEGRADLVFNDLRRSLSDKWENVHLLTSYRYAEVSEASNHAHDDHVTCESLSGLPCILVCEPEQQAAETAWWRDVMNFSGSFLFASDTSEARMMVASNAGWLPTELRENTERSGTVIRRVPLYDANGHATCDYYAFWPKGRDNPYIEEFAKILHTSFEKPVLNIV
jgi:DNA-binding transcriptional LysR family regulator